MGMCWVKANEDILRINLYLWVSLILQACWLQHYFHVSQAVVYIPISALFLVSVISHVVALRSIKHSTRKALDLPEHRFHRGEAK